MNKGIAALLLCIRLAQAEPEFVMITREGASITIKAQPLTRQPMQKMLPPFINLIGEGVIGYDGEKAALTIEARLLNRTEYWPVNEQEGSKKLTEAVVQALDSTVVPFFADIAEQVQKGRETKKQQDIARLHVLLMTDSVQTEQWTMPAGYALAEEIRITFSKPPRNVAILYNQNIMGKISRHEVIFEQEYYTICLENQKAIETAIHQYQETYYRDLALVGETDTERALGLLKRFGFLRESMKEAYGGEYFSYQGRVWCTKHMPKDVNPEDIRMACAKQQVLLSQAMQIYFDTYRKYPDLTKPADRTAFDRELRCGELLHEPAGSTYMNTEGQVTCAVHGKLY